MDNQLGIYVAENMKCLHGGAAEHDQFVVGYVGEDGACDPIAFCHTITCAQLVIDALERYVSIGARKIG